MNKPVPNPIEKNRTQMKIPTKWKTLLLKYSAAGLVNSVVAYAVIFSSMLCGVSATLSNVLGYSVGLILSYLQFRFFVFQSKNHTGREVARFLLGFAVAFLANLSVLRMLLSNGWNPFLSQIASCAVYVIVGFIINSKFVFSRKT